MPTKEDVIENLDSLTERISNRVWTISVGVLATSLAYIIEGAKKEGEPFLEPYLVAGPVAVAILALTADLLQYLAAIQQNVKMLKTMEKSGETSLSYDRTSFFYKVRHAAYWTKVFACGVSALWLVFVSVQRAFSMI